MHYASLYPPRIDWILGPGEADTTVQNFDFSALNSRFKTNAARVLFNRLILYTTVFVPNWFEFYATACAAHTHHGRVCERRKK